MGPSLVAMASRHFSELALFDSLRMAHGQALSLYGRFTTLDSGTRPPLPAVVFRLAASVDLSPTRVGSQSVGPGKQPRCYGPGINPADARWWGLARHGHDPCPGGRTSRHRGDPLGCRFCGSSLGTVAHWMGSCPAFVDLQLEWCATAGVHIVS